MSGSAGDFDYETPAGAGYSAVRQPDPRIAARVHAALADARRVVNVGAGAGSYEPADREVVAVEPSASMRSQRPLGSAPAVDAAAESLPFDDGEFDAAMAMVTVHQWADWRRGLAELRRVTSGPVVLLTFDPAAMTRFWMAEYAPEFLEGERGRFPAIADLVGELGPGAWSEPIGVPLDCTDGFMEAFYGRPEAFMDPAVRAAQSSWGFLDAGHAARIVDALQRDLDSGAWDARYGALRAQPEFQGSLTLVVGPGEPEA